MFQVLDALRDFNGLLEGHFVLTSGRHSDRYLNKDVLYPYPSIMRGAGRELAQVAVREFGGNFDVVLGPEKGGIILAQWTAFSLNQDFDDTDHEVLAVYAEKTPQGFVVRRGMDKLLKGRRVLLVEDVVTTGGSLLEAYSLLVAKHGAKVTGAVCLVERGEAMLPWLRALTRMSVSSWAPEECPLCRDKIPINTEVGHAQSVPQAAVPR